MSDIDRTFHETWLGMVQPIDGLVVSIPVLVDAQCMERQPPHVQAKLVELCPPTRKGEAGPEGYAIADLGSVPLGDARLRAGLLRRGRRAARGALALCARRPADAAPDEWARRRSERPRAVARMRRPRASPGPAYEMLVWELPAGSTSTSRRRSRAPGTTPRPRSSIGSSGTAAFPSGFSRTARSSGSSTPRTASPRAPSPSASTTWRASAADPILDAFVMLLSANRFFGVADDENIKRTLPGILAESRKRQANVTNELADQVFEALQILLRGFEAAAERDGRDLLDDALAREGDHLYKGLLTVLLRLVFVLYAEDRGLLPVEHPFYAEHLSA